MSVTRLTPSEAAQRMQSGDEWVYLDVRSVMEFEKSHVPTSVNIPLLDYNNDVGGLQPNPKFLEVVQQRFTKESPVIVACAAGGRSLRAATEMIAAGFTQIVDMKGGFSGKRNAMGGFEHPGWVQSELPVSSDPHDCEHYRDVLQKSGR